MEISTAQRRARLVTRHHLAGDAASPVEAASSVVALHATDPATVYLSVLARCAGAKPGDISAAMYDDRALVRLLAMRRTLFVVPVEDAPVLHHAASLDVAATIRKRLLRQLATTPTDPQLPPDLEGWLESVEAGVMQAARRRGVATGAQLSADEPRLRTALLPTTDKRYDVRRAITSQVLTLLGAQGRLVRHQPRGSWTSRQHSWEPAEVWWPGGIPEVPAARTRLVEAYLSRFGPASLADVAWWTGWALGVTRAALAPLDLAETSAGLVLAHDVDPDPQPQPVAALLPALDATPMGWKDRSWFLPEDSSGLYDRSGNVGPTVWWGGEVVGTWALLAGGEVRVRLVLDRGQDAARTVQEAASALGPRLDGTPVVPSFPTPWETELRR